jgi:hypothetical protein
MMTRNVFWVSLVLLAGAGAALAGEPVVAFRVEDGFVRFAVTHDDQPVPDVGLKVVDRPGAPFVEGEADEKGVGIFPLPASADCVITFIIAGKETDPILLMFPDKKSRAEPERVLLTFDRRPCCSLSKLRPTNESAGSRSWLPWAEVAVGLACLTGCLWLFLGRRGS